MVQSSESPIFQQINVDIDPPAWYAESVGAALCRLPFSAGGGSGKQKEMTLDCLFFRTSFSIKGHFCSLLLSNIIGYPAFVGLDVRLFRFTGNPFLSAFWESHLFDFIFGFDFAESYRLDYFRFSIFFSHLFGGII